MMSKKPRAEEPPTTLGLFTTDLSEMRLQSVWSKRARSSLIEYGVHSKQLHFEVNLMSKLVIRLHSIVLPFFVAIEAITRVYVIQKLIQQKSCVANRTVK